MKVKVSSVSFSLLSPRNELMIRKLGPWTIWALALFLAQASATQHEDSLFYALTKRDAVTDLVMKASGPDFLLCWPRIQNVGEKGPVYLIFCQPSGQAAWSYLGYEDIDTCFVHYGATLFYREIAYEVHAYFGSLRALPGFPRDPQDPRLPAEAIRRFWEPSFFDP